MRKILFVLLMLTIPVIGFSQLISFSPKSIKTINTKFGVTVPVKTQIFVEDSNMYYKVLAQFSAQDCVATVLRSGNYIRLFSLVSNLFTKSGSYLSPSGGEYLKFKKQNGTTDSLLITTAGEVKKRKAGKWALGSDSIYLGAIDSTLLETKYHAAATYQPIGAYLTDSTRFAQYDSLVVYMRSDTSARNDMSAREGMYCYVKSDGHLYQYGTTPANTTYTYLAMYCIYNTAIGYHIPFDSINLITITENQPMSAADSVNYAASTDECSPPYNTKYYVVSDSTITPATQFWTDLGLNYISVFKPTYAYGLNLCIGNGGKNSISKIDTTYFGSKNTSVGMSSLISNTYGYYNSALGFGSLYSNTTGYRNSAVGESSLYSNTTGYLNTAIGDYSLNANTSGAKNTANGASSLRDNTIGDENTSAGYWSLLSNVSGSSNTAIGASALKSNISGAQNTAIGALSLRLNTASNNTGIGTWSLYNNTTGNQNVAVGYVSLHNNSSGSNNVALGTQSLYETSSNNNTAIGFFALRNAYSGDDNIAIGASAGSILSNGSLMLASKRNIFIGSYSKGLTQYADSNQIVVGDSTIGHGSNTATWGNLLMTDHYFTGTIHGDSIAGAYTAGQVDTLLNAKSDTGHIHPISSITGLQDTIDRHMDTLQSHNTRIKDGERAFDSLSNIYTEDQVDALLSGKAPAFTATTNRYVWKYISGAWRAWPDSVGTAGVTGSGTTGYLPKWNSSTALADSPIYTNGTFVSLGTTSQVVNEKLHISAGNGWGAVIENASTGYGEPALSVASSGAGPANGIAIKSDCGGSSVNYSFWGENGYLYNKHGLSLGQVVPDSLLTVNGGGHIGGGLKVGAKVYFTGLTHQDTATHVLTYNIGTGEVKASSTISVNTTGSSGSCTGNAATVTPNIWQPITGSYASANTFSFSGTAKDALLVTKSLFQAVSSNGATLYAGYIKSAGESGGTVTCTVVSVNALAAGAKNFYVAYNEKITGLENNYRFTNEVPGVISADASYYVGRFYMNVPDTMLIVSTQPDCMTAASGGSPDATYNIYDNTTAVYNTAISMSTNATLADQVPATMYKVAPGHAITLRWLTSAGTVKCSDCSVKITYIPTSILRAK